MITTPSLSRNAGQSESAGFSTSRCSAEAAPPRPPRPVPPTMLAAAMPSNADWQWRTARARHRGRSRRVHTRVPDDGLVQLDRETGFESRSFSSCIRVEIAGRVARCNLIPPRRAHVLCVWRDLCDACAECSVGPVLVQRVNLTCDRPSWYRYRGTGGIMNHVTSAVVHHAPGRCFYLCLPCGVPTVDAIKYYVAGGGTSALRS